MPFLLKSLFYPQPSAHFAKALGHKKGAANDENNRKKTGESK